jgi:hypothetical protein
MITHYGCPIIGVNDMQGEQCKPFEFCLLASERRPS